MHFVMALHSFVKSIVFSLFKIIHILIINVKVFIQGARYLRITVLVKYSSTNVKQGRKNKKLLRNDIDT